MEYAMWKMYELKSFQKGVQLILMPTSYTLNKDLMKWALRNFFNTDSLMKTFIHSFPLFFLFLTKLTSTREYSNCDIIALYQSESLQSQEVESKVSIVRLKSLICLGSAFLATS